MTYKHLNYDRKLGFYTHISMIKLYINHVGYDKQFSILLISCSISYNQLSDIKKNTTNITVNAHLQI